MSVESSFRWTCDGCACSETTVIDHPPAGWATVSLARLRRTPGPGAIAFSSQIAALASLRTASAGSREALFHSIVAARGLWEEEEPSFYWNFCARCEPRVFPIEDTATPEMWEAYRTILDALGEGRAHLKVVE